MIAIFCCDLICKKEGQLMDLNAYPHDLDVLGLSNKGDAYKLIGLYAYNYFFDADEDKSDEALDGIVTDHSKNLIDGIYVNDKLEENTLEIDLTYFPDSTSGFKVSDVVKLIHNAESILEDVKVRNSFTNCGEKLGSALKEALIPSAADADYTIPPILIKVITNYTVDSVTYYETIKKISELTIRIPGLSISCAIAFGSDIEDIIDSNKEPYDFVKDGQLIVDSSKNALRYGEDSIVVNVSAKSLKEIWKTDGAKGLLAMNLRYYIKSAAIDDKIEDSIKNDFNNFWYLNNGIIIVCDDYSFKGNQLKLKNFSIVNGGQTTRMIGTIPFDNDFYLLCKVVKKKFDDIKDKNKFVSKVAEASNTQKPIKAKDIIANKVEQRNLKSLLADNNIFVEIKRGEKFDKTKFVEPWQKTKNNELAQDLYSFVFLEPGPARNNVSNILQDKNKYKKIFETHKYDADFFKSLLYLEKAYRDYSKYIKKNPDTNDATKTGLVSNGLYYTIAIIGFILKLHYNSEYVASLRRYSGSFQALEAYTKEQAFNFKFIPEQPYKDFKKSSIGLFDFVMDNIMVPQYNEDKSRMESLAYSNWTKTNTAFNNICNLIKIRILDNQNGDFYAKVLSYFVKPSDSMNAASIKLYQDNCANNKTIKATDFSGNQLSESCKSLRDELMMIRYQTANKYHIPEQRILTDREIEKLLLLKPANKNELEEVLKKKPLTIQYSGKEILDAIAKYNY